MLRLRDRLLPLVSLQKLLKLDGPRPCDPKTLHRRHPGRHHIFGIIVDRVFDTEEIVVKPVAPILRHIEMFSGNTILGDGSVIMILDPNGIAAASSGELAVGEQPGRRCRGRRTHPPGRQDGPAAVPRRRSRPQGGPARAGRPPGRRSISSAVEPRNGMPVVQYRGKLMPLVPIDAAGSSSREGRQPVLVFADGDRSMGLIVDEIVDIVEDRLQVELAAERPGMMGSAIIAGKATDLIDAGFFLTQAYGRLVRLIGTGEPTGKEGATGAAGR